MMLPQISIKNCSQAPGQFYVNVKFKKKVMIIISLNDTNADAFYFFLANVINVNITNLWTDNSVSCTLKSASNRVIFKTYFKFNSKK